MLLAVQGSENCSGHHSSNARVSGIFVVEQPVAYPSTSLKQNQAVEGLKDLNAGLMDCDQDGAATAAHILDAPHHNRRSPGIQS